MAPFRVSHPPAGATTLIVVLGIISQPKELVVIEVTVVLLTAQAFVFNRNAGILTSHGVQATPPGGATGWPAQQLPIRGLPLRKIYAEIGNGENK